MGKKRQPVYKVVAADVRSPRDGKFIEALGLYNPKTDPVTVEIKEDRVNYWLDVGAQPTDTVKNLLSKKGIFLKRDLVKRGLSEEQIEASILEFNKLQEEKEAKKSKVKGKAKKSETKAESDSAAEVKTETEEKAETEEKIADERASEAKGAASELTETEEKKKEEE
jgi:small subunit ribosomal protein S16